MYEHWKLDHKPEKRGTQDSGYAQAEQEIEYYHDPDFDEAWNQLDEESPSSNVGENAQNGGVDQNASTPSQVIDINDKSQWEEVE